MDANFLSIIIPLLFEGLVVTVQVAVVGIAAGFIIGCISGYALQSKNGAARFLANIYIWIIRGIPLIVLAYWIYFAFPLLADIELDAFTAGCVSIALNSGAFIAELVRGSLQSVDIGQREAGAALGLTHMQILRRIVIPPAFRSMLPALFNQFIISLKDTAILSAVNVNEIQHRVAIYAARSFKVIESYSVSALFYLFIISLLIIVQKQVERHFQLK